MGPVVGFGNGPGERVRNGVVSFHKSAAIVNQNPVYRDVILCIDDDWKGLL